jgi:hypothetical protein
MATVARRIPTRAECDAALATAVVASDPYRRALIEGRDLWVKIDPITKDDGSTKIRNRRHDDAKAQ